MCPDGRLCLEVLLGGTLEWMSFYVSARGRGVHPLSTGELAHGRSKELQLY